jgi:hypothetical protein
MPDTPTPEAKGVSFAGPKPSLSLEELRQVALKATAIQTKPINQDASTTDQKQQ